MTIPNGTLLAEHAQDATRATGPCAICRQDIAVGERLARLLSGKLAHTRCIGRATWRLRTAQ